MEPFDKGTHKQYLQWKMKMTIKLHSDRGAYVDDEDKASYIISCTTGKAFSALSPYVTNMMKGTEVAIAGRIWELLDSFFKDPTAWTKALN